MFESVTKGIKTVADRIRHCSTKMTAEEMARRYTLLAQPQNKEPSPQMQIDIVVPMLHMLDPTDAGRVLQWCVLFLEAWVESGTKANEKKILRTFDGYGYYPGMNCGHYQNLTDKTNVAKHIIGQALSGIRDGEIDLQSIRKQYKAWKARFATNKRNENGV